MAPGLRSGVRVTPTAARREKRCRETMHRGEAMPVIIWGGDASVLVDGPVFKTGAAS